MIVNKSRPTFTNVYKIPLCLFNEWLNVTNTSASKYKIGFHFTFVCFSVDKREDFILQENLIETLAEMSEVIKTYKHLLLSD